MIFLYLLDSKSKMQHDNNNNCNYCGYGPQNLSPNWSKDHSGICSLTHSDDSPENAKNKKEWQKFKNLSQNSGSGQTITLNENYKAPVDMKELLASVHFLLFSLGLVLGFVLPSSMVSLSIIITIHTINALLLSWHPTERRKFGWCSAFIVILAMFSRPD